MVIQRYLIFLLLLFASLLHSQKDLSTIVVSNIDILNNDLIEDLLQIERDDTIKNNLIVLSPGISNTEAFGEVVRQVRKLKDAYEDVYLIPGNLEWDHLGALGVRKLDDLLKEEFDQDILIPDNACGEVEIKNVTDDIVIAAIDSKWYLQNWESDNYINRGCEYKDRQIFWRHFAEEISGKKDKVVLLFAYHPPLRYDKSSGEFPMHTHFLPLPIIGSLIAATKAYTQGYEKATHPRYSLYSNNIKATLRLEPNVLTIGAEGLYQMDHIEDQANFINLNSSDKKEFVASKKLDWSSVEPSYLELRKLEDNLYTCWRSLITRDTLYERLRPLSREIADTLSVQKLQQYRIDQDSVTTEIFKPGDVLDLNDWLFGSLNTDIHYTPVTVPVLDLEKYKGGLSPVRIGGGRQTISVRLTNDEDEFVIRSLKKSPTKLIPPPFDISPAESLVSYYFTASNPYGFLVSSKLEESLDLYRTDPSLMYVPFQDSLAPYNDEIGNKLVLFRARADGDKEEFDNFGNSTNIISTSKLIDKYHENEALVASELFLKARLLDMILNDWDRHVDQWRWAKMDGDSLGLNLYAPIPRDRDQAFSNYDGFFLKYIRQFIPKIFQLKPLDDNLSEHDVKWMHYLATYLDKMILSSLTYEEWMNVGKEMITTLDDATLRECVDNLPEQVDQSFKDKLVSILTSRRDQLPQTIDKYYKSLFKKSLVIGSVYNDSLFVHLSGDRAQVILKTPDEDGSYIEKINRSFSSDATDEIWIYTMDGDDEFIVEGQSSSINVRFLGGFGEDKYTSNYKQSKKVVAYDLEEENNVAENIKLHATNDKEVVSLNRKDFMFNYNWLLPTLAYNSDDGVFIGFKKTFYDFGFKSKWTHSIDGSFAFRRTSASFNYNARYQQELNAFDKIIELSYLGPRYELNYFGFGNGSVYDKSNPEEYYFVRQSKLNLNLGLTKKVMDISELSYRLSFSKLKIQSIDDRFVQSENVVSPEVFERQYYTGLNVAYQLNNFDGALKPENGLGVHLVLDGQKHLNGSRDFISFDASISMMNSVGRQGRFIFSTEVGFKTVWGDPFFYQSPRIGGANSLRGLRRDRFYGDRAFYNSNDLYVYIGKRGFERESRHTWGLTFSLDHGRVWSDSDVTEDWHVNYGTGIFFSPLNAAVLSGSIFFSKNERRLRIGAGWPL